MNDRWTSWVVPSLLLSVALTQMFLAQTQNLSPWKGGGFGMFSTVDSPGMRFLSVRALDQRGEEIQVVLEDVPSRRELRKFASLPRQSFLEKLGEWLMDQEFVPIENHLTATARTLAAQNPGLSLSEADALFADLPIYRVRRTGDPEPTLGGVRRLGAVRVEAWRLRVEAETLRVSCEPLLTRVELGSWS